MANTASTPKINSAITTTAPFALLYTRATGEPATLISLVSLVAVTNGALIQIIMASRVLYGMAPRRLDSQGILSCARTVPHTAAGHRAGDNHRGSARDRLAAGGPGQDHQSHHAGGVRVCEPVADTHQAPRPAPGRRSYLSDLDTLARVVCNRELCRFSNCCLVSRLRCGWPDVLYVRGYYSFHAKKSSWAIRCAHWHATNAAYRVEPSGNIRDIFIFHNN